MNIYKSLTGQGHVPFIHSLNPSNGVENINLSLGVEHQSLGVEYMNLSICVEYIICL